jgi:hypothetical protein
MYDLRGGSGNLDRGDKWSYCLMAGTLCPLDQERP